MQLTSTLMTSKWTIEFGWLLNWMNVKFKIVSDMTREENGVMNYEAGIDLLEHFYNIQGYSTPILIYCSNVEKAKENAAKRKVKKNNIYRITNSHLTLREYLKFE